MRLEPNLTRLFHSPASIASFIIALALPTERWAQVIEVFPSHQGLRLLAHVEYFLATYPVK